MSELPQYNQKPPGEGDGTGKVYPHQEDDSSVLMITNYQPAAQPQMAPAGYRTTDGTPNKKLWADGSSQGGAARGRPSYMDSLDGKIPGSGSEAFGVDYELNLILGVPYSSSVLHQSLQRAVAKFTDDFNREVMEPRGMFFKTQTSGVTYTASSGDSSVSIHQEVSWGSIALTPTEVQALRQEENQFCFNPCGGTHSAHPLWNSCCRIACCCGVRQVM
ncbi:hypothetical protein HDU88_000154 [Geranomyces variabilis]|nr:hypothetical protein HDU88_000154 [Geranomyces variabilis]